MSWKILERLFFVFFWFFDIAGVRERERTRWGRKKKRFSRSRSEKFSVLVFFRLLFCDFFFQQQTACVCVLVSTFFHKLCSSVMIPSQFLFFFVGIEILLVRNTFGAIFKRDHFREFPAMNHSYRRLSNSMWNWFRFPTECGNGLNFCQVEITITFLKRFQQQINANWRKKK